MNDEFLARRRAYEAEVRRHFRRNYLVHCLDGGFWTFAMAFLAADTVLPPMIRSLGGPNWLISLMPQMMFLGFTFPPMLTAHWAENRPLLKWPILLTGVGQRLPYLGAGLALLVWADTRPLLTLTLVALTPWLSGVFGGLGFSGWIEMTSRLIPAQRRSSATAIRLAMGAVLGVLAGQVVRHILEAHPGPEGFGWLHLCTFGVLLASLGCFALFREPTYPPAPDTPRRSLRQNLAGMREILRDDHRFRHFIYARVSAVAIFIVTPSLAIHAIETVEDGPRLLGSLVQSTMVGGIIGNLLAGWMGDRYGGKRPLLLSQVCYFLSCLIMLWNDQAVGFLAIFALNGAASVMGVVGSSTLQLEISPPNRRPTYTALVSIILVPTLLLAALVNTLIAEWVGHIAPAVILAACGMIAANRFLNRFPEPRLAGAGRGA